jgi:hypothetical protein
MNIQDNQSEDVITSRTNVIINLEENQPPE